MAQIISQPGKGAPASEHKVHRALAALPGEYTILHSVAWQGRRGDRSLDGEADFLVIHSRGLMAIEVKGGDIHVENGQWKSTDRHGQAYSVKNPFEQATTSKAVLHKWLKDRLDFDVPTCHAVALPAVWDSPELGPVGPREIMFTGQDLDAIHGPIKRAFSHARRGFRLLPAQIKDIVQALAPTVAVRRRLSDEAREAQSALITLTDEQKDFFNAARRNIRLAVFGGAGTGKTVLACEKARQLKAEGNSVLLTCYNKLLADTLRRDPSLQGIEVRNFHSLCMTLAYKAELEVPKEPDKNFWEQEAPLVLMQATEDTGTSFDAVVVDEGQDFGVEWIEALESICTHGKDSPFVVFFDSNQQLWDRQWSPGTSYFQLELTKNCRNTLPIAERVARIVGAPVQQKGAAGPAPKWTQWLWDRNLESRVQRILRELFEEGFSPSNVIVLCESSKAVKRLRNADFGDMSLNPLKHQFFLLKRAFSSNEGESDGEGKKFVECETIARFKGLEALAVVLVLDPEPRKLPDANAYVGFSRAVSYLRVLANPSRQQSVHWA